MPGGLGGAGTARSGAGRGVVGPGGEEGAAGERGVRLRAEGVGSRGGPKRDAEAAGN